MIYKIIGIVLCTYIGSTYAAENPYIEQQKKDAAKAQAQNSKQLQDTFSKNTEETLKKLQPEMPPAPAAPAQPKWEQAIAPKSPPSVTTPPTPNAPVTTNPPESSTEQPTMPPNPYR